MGSAANVALDTSILLHRPGLIVRVREMIGKKRAMVIPEQVLMELAVLEKRKTVSAKKMAALQEILETNGVKKKKVEAENADEALEKLAENGFSVLTLDKELKKKIAGKKGFVLDLQLKGLE